MNNIFDITSSALNDYFKVLKHKGYLKNAEVDKVLIVSFIEEMLDDKFFEFITEKDYQTIINAINRLCSHSSIIRFPSFDVYTDLIQDIRTYNKFKITENSNLRLTENNTVRITMQ